MSLFEGKAPPDIQTTRTTAASAPKYLTDYLTDLASAGQSQLGKTGEELVAGQGALQQQAFKEAPGALTRYQQPLSSALSAGQAAAAPTTAADISAFYNPYEQQVVNDLARQSAMNVQQTMLPQLRGAFAGTGAFGSRRYAGATGQALADVQQDLLSQQAKLRAAGYTSALDAALRQRQTQAQAAQALAGTGSAEVGAAKNYLDVLSNLGQQQQAYEQAKIEAPLMRAQNVAQIMRGYTYPTTVEETYKGPGTVYQPSPLQQIAGLGALLGSGFNTPGGWGNRLAGLFGRFVRDLPGSQPDWWPEGIEGGP
jgi:hypothetical protein